MNKLRFRVTGDSGAWNYFTGPDSDWDTTWQAGAGVCGYQSSQTITTNILANIPANSYQVFEIPVFAGRAEANGTAVVDEIYVKINKVRLLQTADNDATVRDWAIIRDFDTRDCSSGNHFCFTGAEITAMGGPTFPGYNNALTKGIAKNDPRVRRFTFWDPPGAGTAKIQPWTPVGPTDGFASTIPNVNGAENSTVDYQVGTGLASVPNDPNPSNMTDIGVTNHPSFYMKTTGSNLPYESVGELGYIHTGLQWRTLRLQPRPASEATANLIPDWAVLDIFSVTNASVQGKININGVVTNLYSGDVNWQHRIEPIRAVTTAIAPPFGPATGASGADATATNIYFQTWAPGSTWGADRSTAPNRFTPLFYNMIGELCEIDLVSTNYAGATNDAMREARIRTFANLVTVRSEQFTVHAVGQAIQDVNSNGAYDPGTDLILGESKIRTVVTRIQGAGSDGQWGTSDDTVEYRCLEYKYLN